MKLREDEVSTLTSASAYEKLIAAFVNEAKETVEVAWQWNALHDAYDITTVSGTQTYPLVGWGDEFTIEMVFNNTDNCLISGPSQNSEVSFYTSIGTTSTGAPTWWDIYGVDSNGDPNIRFYAIPDEELSITVYGYHKQAYLETSTDDETVMLVPWKPVVFSAYAKALSERGEDGGQIYDESVMAADAALSDAIALDAAQGRVNTDWHNYDLK